MPIDKAQRPTVRIRVLRGALSVGSKLYTRNMSVEVDKEFAELLVKDSPQDYQIMAVPAPKQTVRENKPETNEVK